MAGPGINSGNAIPDGQKKPGVVAFSCPNCGGQIEVHAFGHSLTSACIHCSSLIDISNPQFRLLEKHNTLFPEKLLYIPIGSRGKINGTTWEVVGFMQRNALGYDFVWQEYLLFNPWEGYRWLTETYGHWTFVSPLPNGPDGHAGAMVVHHQKKAYASFNRGKARVQRVTGEFYWQVKVGQITQTADYIVPPRMISLEKSDSEIVWSIGEHLDASDVNEAFGLKTTPLPKTGVGAVQPNPHYNFLSKGVPALILFLAALFVITALKHGLSQNKVVAEKSFKAGNQTKVVIPDIVLEGKTSNVNISLWAPFLSNDWVEADGYLFNSETGQTFGFTYGAEYYSGTDSDGSWSEGSNKTWTLLEAIPPGEYELVLDFVANPDLHPGGPPVADTLPVTPNNSPADSAALKPSAGSQSLLHNPIEITVEVTRDVPIWSNWWIAAILLTLPVGLFTWAGASFEARRWGDSDDE